MAEAAERDLRASKPLGDSENFEGVVGRPGKFVGVQVKGTVFRSKNGEGYVCSVSSSHEVYRSGRLIFWRRTWCRRRRGTSRRRGRLRGCCR
jgi:hypothetical protein